MGTGLPQFGLCRDRRICSDPGVRGAQSQNRNRRWIRRARYLCFDVHFNPPRLVRVGGLFWRSPASQTSKEVTARKRIRASLPQSASENHFRERALDANYTNDLVLKSYDLWPQTAAMVRPSCHHHISRVTSSRAIAMAAIAASGARWKRAKPWTVTSSLFQRYSRSSASKATSTIVQVCLPASVLRTIQRAGQSLPAPAVLDA